MAEEIWNKTESNLTISEISYRRCIDSKPHGDRNNYCAEKFIRNTDGEVACEKNFCSLCCNELADQAHKKDN